MLTAVVDGFELSYQRLGRGPVLTLLHGHPLDHSIWEQVAPLLADSFDLVIPDLRGFGRSASPPGPYSIADMAGDIAGLLKQLGITQSALVGHSMGGYIALAYCRAFPQQVRALGLVSSQVGADPPDRRPARYEMAARVEMHGMQVIAETFPEKLTSSPDLQPQLRQIILRQGARGVAESLRAMAERQDSTGLLARFRFPVVFIHGGADVVIPVERAREASRLMPRSCLVEIERAGHMPMLEDPQRTARALLDCLE